MSYKSYTGKFLITLLFVLALLVPSKAETNGEVIIQVPGINAKNMDQVKQQLTGIAGVTYKGFCNSEKFFLLGIDRNIQPDNSAIEGAMKTFELEYFFKEGGFNAAMAGCTDEKIPVGTTDTGASPE